MPGLGALSMQEGLPSLSFWKAGFVCSLEEQTAQECICQKTCSGEVRQERAVVTLDLNPELILSLGRCSKVPLTCFEISVMVSLMRAIKELALRCLKTNKLGQ